MLQNQPIPLKPGFKNLHFKVKKKKKVILFYSCHISNKAASCKSHVKSALPRSNYH